MNALWLLSTILQFYIGKVASRSSTKYNSLPESLTLVVRYSKTDFFTFHLEKIPDNVDKVKVIVGDKNGPHDSPQDPNKHFGIYKDKKFYATFSVFSNKVNNKDVYSYYGSFRIDRDIYTLEPVFPNDKTSDNAFDKNYIVTIDSLKYHLRKKVDTSHGGEDKTSVFRNDSSYVNPGKKGESKKYRGKKQILTIEVLVILDYSIYTKWMKLMDNNKYKAVENMKYYFTEIVNGIKMRYENIKMHDYMFTVALAGFYIAETPNMVPFIENNEVKVNNVVNSIMALAKFANWIAAVGNKILPRFDVAALFTVYQMPGINGLAYISGVCRSIGVSLNRDNGPFMTADTAAHEIGHNVGANHDGEKNACNFHEQFIMASGRSTLTETTYDNPFHFSNCSLGYFLSKLYYLNLEKKNCMEDYPESSKPVEFEKFFNGSFGQKFTLVEQCRIAFGPKARLCSRGHKDNTNMCFSIGCYDSHGQCVSLRPAFGTSCALKSWCIKGRCVKDKNAPTFKDYCRVGDSTEPINTHSGSMTCKQLITKNPKYCSQQYYKDLCCDSCGQLENIANKNCPFGDRHLSCNSKYCESPYYRSVCCKTCGVSISEKLPEAACDGEESLSWCRNPNSELCYTENSRCCVGCAMLYEANLPGCEYGDHGMWCADRVRRNPKECQSEKIFKSCCRSCKNYGGKESTKNEKSTPGCQDKQDCRSISAWHCYSMEDSCCATCEQFKTDDKKCKYGDHAPWCKQEMETRMEYCSDESNSYTTSCCGTCRGYQKKPKDETKESCVDKHACSYVTRNFCYEQESECCATCKRLLVTGNKKDCRYGDKFEWCISYVTGPIECQSADTIKDCCDTCSPYVKKGINQRG